MHLMNILLTGIRECHIHGNRSGSHIDRVEGVGRSVGLFPDELLSGLSSRIEQLE